MRPEEAVAAGAAWCGAAQLPFRRLFSLGLGREPVAAVAEPGREPGSKDFPGSRGVQEALSRGALKKGLNVVLAERPKRRSDADGLRQCLSEFKQQLAWVERLDVTSGQVMDPSLSASNKDAVDPENDFQREMSFYQQAQAEVLEALPRLHKLQVSTRRPNDYFAEMAKSDQMQKVCAQLKSKQEAMEKSEKEKQLVQYGKKVQTEILQRRQKEKKKKKELNAVKKYQESVSDKLDLDKEQTSSQGNKKGFKIKKGPNAKRYKNQKIGFGGKKKGSKWNTMESFNDISSFRSKVALNKGPGNRGKKALNKRLGKRERQKMKSQA
ncbi:LOW QUALITY PROTEIN: putative rRNA-processing protein EBP2 [Leptosomus discolor]